MTERLVVDDPPTRDELAAARRAAESELSSAPFDANAAVRLYITGGTGEFSFRLIAPKSVATVDDIDLMLVRLAASPASELAETIAIPIARARVLPAGVAVVRALVDLAHPAAIYAAQSGIRRGLLLAAFAGSV